MSDTRIAPINRQENRLLPLSVLIQHGILNNMLDNLMPALCIALSFESLYYNQIITPVFPLFF